MGSGWKRDLDDHVVEVLCDPRFDHPVCDLLGVFGGGCQRKACWSNLNRNAIAGGVVFVALAIWCLKFPAPLGPPVEAMSADYLPRPGAQFLWLYQILKYVPGGLGSIVGVVLPTVGIAILFSCLG